jgi:hypothetical protein
MAGATFSEKVSRDPRDMIFMPTREFIAGLEVGGKAPNCFGDLMPVLEITYRGEDTSGRLFVCYYVRFGLNGRMSGALKENEINRTIALTNRYQSEFINRLELITLGLEEAS